MSRQANLRHIPTHNQKLALRGTKGTPGRANRYVTEVDPRITGRNPGNHASTHEPCGDDVIDHFAIVTADPVASSPLPSPACDSFWLIRNGTSPETFSFRGIVDGVIQDLGILGTDSGSPSGGGDLTLIDEQTPTGSSVTFASLGAYTHLMLHWSARSTEAATSSLVNVQFNGDTGANYDRQVTISVAAAPFASELLASTSFQIGSAVGATGTAGACGGGTFHMYDYRGTTFHKVGTAKNAVPRTTASGDFFEQSLSVRWRSTNAITSMVLTLSGGSFATGSKFSLYGLL